MSTTQHFRTGHEHESFGFTLIELLIVISIVSLLIAILLPALSKAKQSATSLVCLTHERQIATGISSYGSDYKDYIPAAMDRLSGTTDQQTWMYSLWNYMGYTSGKYEMSADISRGVQLGSGTADTSIVFYCPVSSKLRADTPAPAGCTNPANYSYGLNIAPAWWSLNQDKGVGMWSPGWSAANPNGSSGFDQGQFLPQRTEQTVRRPSDTALFIECGGYSTGDYWKLPAWGAGKPGGIIPHLGGANVTFHDMHAQRVPDEDIPYSTWLHSTTPAFWKGR